ncbi:hypothetical protein [Methanogenium cariaci]|uniref:hypothetical protein n=1 Tax=Methanogenium cariaci TaxID=2197 RepID=UPI0024811045|nr:hypothetical protein [Methanogenium cariaci]
MAGFHRNVWCGGGGGTARRYRGGDRYPPVRHRPGWTGYPAHWEALVVPPRPGVFEGQALGRAGGATAMMDVSDGLSISLHDLAEASGGVRLDVTEAAIPRPEGVPAEDAARYALFGGGDFGLLFTCPEDVFPVAGGWMRHASAGLRPGWGGVPGRRGAGEGGGVLTLLGMI